jgi:hypothetical protein
MVVPHFPVREKEQLAMNDDVVIEKQCEWEPVQIDQLIEWVIYYDERRWEDKTTAKEDEDFLSVFSALSDLRERGAMPEKQRLVFEEVFGLSGSRGECVCGGGCDGC